MSDQQRVTFRLSGRLLEQLRMLSDQQDVPMSKIVRDVLTRYLERMF